MSPSDNLPRHGKRAVLKWLLIVGLVLDIGLTAVLAETAEVEVAEIDKSPSSHPSLFDRVEEFRAR